LLPGWSVDAIERLTQGLGPRLRKRVHLQAMAVLKRLD
jgi:hypothetical protein